MGIVFPQVEAYHSWPEPGSEQDNKDNTQKVVSHHLYYDPY